jgi:hypothetical protein
MSWLLFGAVLGAIIAAAIPYGITLIPGVMRFRALSAHGEENKMADSHSATLQEAYLLERFERERGQKATSKIELLEWLAEAQVSPDGPDFEAWLRQRQAARPAIEELIR